MGYQFLVLYHIFHRRITGLESDVADFAGVFPLGFVFVLTAIDLESGLDLIRLQKGGVTLG